jgi:hypothetical protein
MRKDTLDGIIVLLGAILIVFGVNLAWSWR